MLLSDSPLAFTARGAGRYNAWALLRPQVLSVPVQTTLARVVELAGVGLHTGEPCCLRLLPAEAGRGVLFRLNGAEIPARSRWAAPARRCTALARGRARVCTVEHLLAALYALDVDNVIAEVEGPEVPAGDGSALPFVRLLQQGGRRRQALPRPLASLDGPVWVARGPACLVALPSRGLRITVGVHYPGTPVGSQHLSLRVGPAAFASEIAPARTVAFAHEAAGLQAAGLGLGGNPGNVLVIGSHDYASPPRWPDEVARHKLLDLLGDLSLVGHRFGAHIVGIRPGHALNRAIARLLSARLEGSS